MYCDLDSLWRTKILHLKNGIEHQHTNEDATKQYLMPHMVGKTILPQFSWKRAENQPLQFLT